MMVSRVLNRTPFRLPFRNAARSKRLDDLEPERRGSLGAPGQADPSLCDFCGGALFRGLLEGRVSNIGMPSFMARWRDPDCVLCRMFRKEVRKSSCYMVLRPTVGTDKFCALAVARPDADLYPRREAVSGFRQIEVKLIENDPSLGEEVDSPAEYVATLDIIEPPSTLERVERMHAMVRVPQESIFDVSLLKQWIEACNLGHQHVRKGNQRQSLEALITQGRFRVMDVVTRKVITLARPERYLALSYVWGDSMHHYASTHKDSPAFGTIDDENLPLTVRDSMRLVKKIGERYIWVDAFCMDQSDAQDKQMVVAAMGAIYSSAYLTIIAAHGADASTGLCRLNEDSSLKESPVWLNSHGLTTYGLLPARGSLQEALKGTTWQSRAWTYQEHIMSPRCAIFTRNEVFLECSEAQFRECYTLVDPPSGAIPGVGHTQRISAANGKRKEDRRHLNSHAEIHYRHYAEVVRVYTRRDLTHTGDRLDAFRAVLDVFQSADISAAQDLVESGIPLAYMARALLWEQDVQDREPMVRIATDARQSRVFPTWSWIGWSGHITSGWDYRALGAAPLTFRVLDDGNIIAESTGEDDAWRPWPFPPRPCTPDGRGCVTIHFWAPVISVRLLSPVKSREGDFQSCKMVYAGPRSDFQNVCVGEARVDPKIFDTNRADHRYDVILFRTGNIVVDLLLIDYRDEFAHRISHWTKRRVGAKSDGESWLSIKRLEEVQSTRHIRLR